MKDINMVNVYDAHFESFRNGKIKDCYNDP